MIIDTLNNASIYEALSPGFAKAFAYLRSDRPMTDPTGSHKLDGDAVYVDVHEYNTRSADQGRFEMHHKYADVQYVVNGRERMSYARLGDLKELQAYDAKKDAAFYDGRGAMVDVPAGTFVVFMPKTPHMACLMAGDQPAPVRKVVVKVRING